MTALVCDRCETNDAVNNIFIYCIFTGATDEYICRKWYRWVISDSAGQDGLLHGTLLMYLGEKQGDYYGVFNSEK